MSQLNLNALSTSGQYQEHVAFWTDALGRLDEDFRLQQAWQAYALPLGPEPTLTFALDGDAAPVLESSPPATRWARSSCCWPRCSACWGATTARPACSWRRRP